MILPRYSIYVPSKGRAQTPLKIRFLQRDEVPYYVVVEPSQVEAYAPLVEADQLLVLPKDGLKLVGARNWIKDHATAAGHARHWQIDDNIRRIVRSFDGGRRIRCPAGPALAAVEDFTDLHENIAIAGLNYSFFAYPQVPPMSTVGET